MYLSVSQAEDALIDARTRYNYASGSGPVTIYKCDDCGQYHLTSRGVVNERLAQLLKDGKINAHKQANDWLEKLKRKR